MGPKRAFRPGRPDVLEGRLVMSHVVPLAGNELARRLQAQVALADRAEGRGHEAAVAAVRRTGTGEGSGPVTPTQAPPGPSALALANDPILLQNLYSPAKTGSGGATSDVAADGAVSVNAKWEAGQSSVWYIEEQRYGADLITKGVVRNDDSLINKGLAELNWGFARQGPAGDFPGTSDAFHSTSFFVEAAARAMLVLRQSGNAAYQGAVAQDTPKIEAAARWLMEPAVVAAGRAGDAPYTHRRYMLAAALGETAALTGDQPMAAAAETYARTGLSEQTPQGVNPEKGGYDVSYQALGILLAARYDSVCPDPTLRAEIAQMIGKALNWELTKVDARGDVSAAGSTRTDKEYGPAGNLKTVNYPVIVEAFTAGAAITGNPTYEATAAKIAAANDLQLGT